MASRTRANPAILANILNAPKNAIRRQENMRLMVGGAPLTPAFAEKARERLTPHVFTAIGSTEVGTWALTRIERPEDLRSHRIVPNCDVQIVDEADGPVPAGTMGLVRVRSPDRVRSYLNDEEASRAFFRNGFFYTGDLGTFSAEDRLTLHGRITNVINVAGDKHAAEPIELALQEHLAASGVCILAVPGKDIAEELHVFIETDKPIGRQALTEALQAQLRSFAQARVHFVPALPRNMTGKVDRLVLKRQLFKDAAPD